MNITAISSLLPALLQTGNNSATGKTSQAALDLSPASDASISPLARFLSLLQQLQQQNPDEFKQVVSGIADRLRELAKTAQAGGNSAQADQVKKLADQFQTTAKHMLVPTSLDLELAGAANRLALLDLATTNTSSNSLLPSILGSPPDSTA